MNKHTELIVKMSLDAWNSNVKKMTATFDGMSDEQMMTEIAPGKNRPVYLLGHIAAVHDRMIPLMGLGERKLEHLDNAFLASPDKTISEIPSIAELRTAYNEANATLDKHFSTLSAADWFAKHTAVSDEDFAKEPHRNKLNILNSRAGHVAYHQGQLALVKK